MSIYNAFGNIVALLNPTSEVVGSLGPAGSLPLLFTSREFDAETGLYYNRARYLDPTTGRWTTQDPLGFAAGDANLYRYVSNHVTTATDPSGNIFFVPMLVIGGVALGGVGIAGLHYSAHRYDYAREHYLSRPIQQWTPELQAEYRDYARTTDRLAVGSTIAAGTGIVLVSVGGGLGQWLRPGPGVVSVTGTSTATTGAGTAAITGEGMTNAAIMRAFFQGQTLARTEANIAALRWYLQIARDALARYQRMGYTGPGVATQTQRIQQILQQLAQWRVTP
jgi:RHS repeat-associated protein